MANMIELGVACDGFDLRHPYSDKILQDQVFGMATPHDLEKFSLTCKIAAYC